MKRYKSILVGAILVLVAMLSSTTLYASTNNTGENSFDEAEFVDVSYYSSSYSSIHSFVYNDSMMLTDANDLSGDLAKVSVGLAVASYTQGEIKDCFRTMGYDMFAYNYEKTSTYENNDFVAYSIGYKSITYNGVTYNTYIVPIRGTKANCEWFSNFNLGNRSDGYHEGFKLAADEILATIKSKVKTENNIFLVTGHSRGAAVANIVAGELSNNYNYATKDRIHAYTFACPAVRLNVSGTLNNIRNYNNMGDVIAAIPLEEWGYGRYGVDMPLSADQEIYSNFKSRFKSVYGEEYGGTLSTDSFVSALKSFANTREDYYSAENQFLFDVVGWYLGERTPANAVKVVSNHNVSYVSKKSLISILTNAVSGTIQYGIDTEYRNNIDFLAQIDEALTETSGMEQIRFDYWVSDNYSLISEISDKIDIDIETRSDLVVARNTLESSLDDISYMATSIESIINLFYATDGEPIPAVFHAHTQETYVLWINTVYYGSRGWFENLDIEDISIGSEVTTVDDSCFFGCNNAVRVTMSDSVKYVGDSAFHNCRGLKEAVIGDSVKSLGTYAFFGCTDLEILTMPISAKFEASSYKELNSLKTLHYTLGTGETFESVYGPAYVNYADSDNDCGGETLTTVIFEEGIREIIPKMFYGCENLTTVKLPSTLETIGDYAFFNCINWSDELVLPEKLISIGNSAFCNAKITGDLVLPEGITELNSCAFGGCSELRSIKSTGNVMVIVDGCFSGCSGLKEVVIGNKIKKIEYCAFEGCSGLETLIIPESVTDIGEAAFVNCKNLKNIIIPNSVTDIGSSAFLGCDSLTGITIPDGVTNIGIQMFRECDSLTSITIPDAVTSIGYCAFYGCDNLTSIRIPNSVTIVDGYAFADCISLTDVYYEGTEEQWNKINIYSGNDYLLNANIHFNSSEDIPQYPLGDVNNDNVVSVMDATNIQKYLAGITTLSEAQILNGDVNNDGVLSVIDATQIQKYLAGLIKQL